MKITSKTALTVGDGRYSIEPNLFLVVRNNGRHRAFVYRYTFAGKRRDLSLGTPSEKTVMTAKQDASRCRILLSKGIDPKALRDQRAEEAKQNASVPTFMDYVDCILPTVLKVKQYKNRSNVNALYGAANLASKAFGHKKVSEITPKDILALLEPYWQDRTPYAIRIRSHIECIMNYAKRDGFFTGENPAAWRGNLSTWLPSPSRIHKFKHLAAASLDTTKKIVSMMLDEDSPGYPQTRQAIIFGILTATRKVEFTGAMWSEFDFETMTWSVPPERRKDGKPYPFRVPISKQLLRLLQSIGIRSEGPVFPSRYYPDRKMRMENVSSLIRRIAPGEATMHGFRSTFRDWAAENGVDSIIAEKCLSHATGNAVEQAYQRSDLLEQRRPVMQQWADAILPMDALEAALAERK